MPNRSHVPERRHFGRRLVALEGLLELPLRPPIPCRVLDLSAVGARVEALGVSWLPAHFRLYVASSWHDCDVRHRDGSIVGVVFAVPTAD